MLKKLMMACLFASTTHTAMALEPLKDRAQVQHMNADLLLPTGKVINVDVSFDCGSDYRHTAVMVMSDSGAQLMAAAYTHLFGAQYGQNIMNAWNNKAKASDPRKPTYLFIMSPRDKNYDWRQGVAKNDVNKKGEGVNSFAKSKQNDYNFTEGGIERNASEVPMFAAGCGTIDHPAMSF